MTIRMVSQASIFRRDPNSGTPTKSSIILRATRAKSQIVKLRTTQIMKTSRDNSNLADGNGPIPLSKESTRVPEEAIQQPSVEHPLSYSVATTTLESRRAILT